MSTATGAYIQAIPAKLRGRVLGKFSNGMSIFLALSQWAFCVVMMVPWIGLGVWIAETRFPGKMNEDVRAYVITGAVAFGLGFSLWLYWWLERRKWSNKYYRRLLVGALRERTDTLVDPQNPDAVIVEIMPREFWAKPNAESTIDMGYFVADGNRRCLLFEGDRSRYQIPFEAIRHTTIEWILDDICALVVNYQDPDQSLASELSMIIKTDIAGVAFAGSYFDQARIIEDRIHEA